MWPYLLWKVLARRAWKARSLACSARATKLFSAVLLSTGLGVLIAGMGIFQAKKRAMLSRQLPYRIAVPGNSKNTLLV